MPPKITMTISSTSLILSVSLALPAEWLPWNPACSPHLLPLCSRKSAGNGEPGSTVFGLIQRSSCYAVCVCAACMSLRERHTRTDPNVPLLAGLDAQVLSNSIHGGLHLLGLACHTASHPQLQNPFANDQAERACELDD